MMPNGNMLRLKRPWKGQIFIAIIFDLHADPSGVECFLIECNSAGVGGPCYLGSINIEIRWISLKQRFLSRKINKNYNGL